MLNAKTDALQQSQRKEIAALLGNGKLESARIKVEFLIQQDYNREAMEMLELFCDLLMARFGLFSEKQLDPSIQEAVHTIIWAASRASSDIKELLVIKALLQSRYGRDFVDAASNNRLNLANPRVVQRLSVSIPSAKMVNAYLREIAAKYGITLPHELSEEAEKEAEISVASPYTSKPEVAFPTPEIPKSVQAVQEPQAATRGSTQNPDSSANTSLTGSRTQTNSLPTSGETERPICSDSSSPVVPSAPPAIDDSKLTSQSIRKFNTNNESAIPPGYDASDSPPDFDELAKRFEELKKRK